ncbi:MAG: hypothetical protein L0Y79_08780 [Chlorobi bacterium]|nr:hypothetical protein [Chlorobiota bacterium]MCI0716402.1 hypothetical protein [Chlorobiota bacterium]
MKEVGKNYIDELISILKKDEYTVISPVLRDGAIVYIEIQSVNYLPQQALNFPHTFSAFPKQYIFRLHSANYPKTWSYLVLKQNYSACIRVYDLWWKMQ